MIFANRFFTLICIIFVSFSSKSYSQNSKKFDLSISFGLNTSFLIGKGVDEYKFFLDQSMEPYSQLGVNWSNSFIPRIGLSSGLIAECLLTNNFGFKTGFNFSQRGFAFKQEWELPTDNSEISSLNYKFQELTNVHLNYLDYPILLTRKLNDKSSIALGGILSFILIDNVIVNTREEYQTYDANDNIQLIIDESILTGNYRGLISDDSPDFILGGLCLEFNYKIKRLGVSSKLTRYNSVGTLNGASNNNKNLVFNISLIYKIKKT